ncbi:MAG: GTPase [Ilumatobacteraceae bacterium]
MHQPTPTSTRSGFVAVVGRPSVGKSTLVNAMCGTKVSIVSDKPQTTRTRVRGVLTRPDVQLVFVDTPGLHSPSPRSASG